MELHELKCETCVPGTPSLDRSRSKELHSQIDPSWELEDDEIERKFKFSDFKEAFDFAGLIAALAEEEGHHPDLKVGWGYVKVRLKTHAAKGLTENDFILASKIDRL